MPEITIKYEHPHELTELLSKLAQMYIVPQAICNVDTPYLPDCVKNESLEYLKVQLKDAEQRESILSAQYSAACRDIDELKSKNFEILSRFTVWKNKVTREKALKDEYKNILEQIFDILIPKEPNPHGLSEFTMEDRMDSFPVIIENIMDENKFMKDNSPFIADSDNQLFTLKEAAEYLKVSETRVMSLFAKNNIRILWSDLREVKSIMGGGKS